MSRTRVRQSRLGRTVGYFVIEYYDDGSHACYIEEDYGSNTYGDIGLFYKNNAAFKHDGGICYVSTVPYGVMYCKDYGADMCMYTYDIIMEICKYNKAAAELVYELAVGQSIEAIYDDIKDILEDEEGE